MKTKNFLLGIGEGILIAIIIPLVLYFKKHTPELIGVEIPPMAWTCVMMIVVISSVLLITNNVHKLVFVETFVPVRERVCEWIGGILAIILVTVLILRFMPIL